MVANCCIYTSANIKLARGCSPQCALPSICLPTGSQINQLTCRTHTSTLCIVEIWETCTLARVQLTHSHQSLCREVCQCLCTVADKSKLNFSIGGCKSAIHLAPLQFGQSLFLWGTEAGAPQSTASAHLRPNGSSADSLCSAGILLFLDRYFLEGNKQHLAPVQASLMGWRVGERSGQGSRFLGSFSAFPR